MEAKAMKNKIYKTLVYVLGVIPPIVLALLYSKIPDEVPTHWDIDGTVTYSGKANLWVIALMGIIFAVLFDVLPKIDPRKENYKKFNKYYDVFCLSMIAFIDVMFAIILFESFAPGKISVAKVVMILTGLLFIFIGNILPKIKNNFYMGIKTPWTLSNADVWNKTNRLGGKLMFLLGVVVALSAFLVTEQTAFWILMSGLIMSTGIPTVMSYIWYRNSVK